MSPGGNPDLRRKESETRRTHREHRTHGVCEESEQFTRLVNARDFAVLQGADMPSSTHASSHPGPAQRRAHAPAILPAHAPRALPRSSRERLYFLYFTRRHPRAPDARRAESAATPRPSTARALSRDRRASVYTSYTSLSDTHGRQTHEGRKVPPLPAPIPPAPSPARVARASILLILHSPTPTGARRTKGGKCCHSPPPSRHAVPVAGQKLRSA
jgi:hypothetical protein